MIKNKMLRICYVLSFCLSGGISFLTFVLFLQTPLVSVARLTLVGVIFFVTMLASCFVCFRWLIPRLNKTLSGANTILNYSFLIPLAFLPLYFVTPQFPISPLLRPKTYITLQYHLNQDSQPVTITDKDIRVIVGKEVSGYKTFQLDDNSKPSKNFLVIQPGSSKILKAEISTGSTVTLKIVVPSASGDLTIYWDENISSFRMIPAFSHEIALKKKFGTPFFMTTLYFVSFYFVIVYVLLFMNIWLDSTPNFNRVLEAGLIRSVPVVVFLLALITVYFQVRDMFGNAPFTIDVDQYQRHLAVLQGISPNPWQYRVFSEWVVEVFIRFFQVIFPGKKAIVLGFLTLRFLQNMTIFILAFTIYKIVSRSNWLGVLGILILSSSMLRSHYDSDISLNTYFDVIFYLLAMLFIIRERYFLIVLLMLFASLNRETSGLIPFLPLIEMPESGREENRKKYFLVLISLLIYLGIFVGLRAIFPDRPLFVAYGHMLGNSMWHYNVDRSITWEQLFYTLGLLPIISILYFFELPQFWRRLWLLVVPVWLGVHFIGAVVAETRLFLVPEALVFVPCFLLILASPNRDHLNIENS